MQAQKFGTINHTTTRVTFGAWAAFYMKWLLYCLHLEQQVCKHSAKKLREEFTQQFLPISVKTWGKLFLCVSKSILKKDHHVTKFCQAIKFWIIFLEISNGLKDSTMVSLRLIVFLRRSDALGTFTISQTNFQNLNILEELKVWALRTVKTK
jgi:hypothetical protein